MEPQIASAYLKKRRILNALLVSNLCKEDLNTLNLEAWKLAARCSRFPESFDSYMDPSFLISDCLEYVLESCQDVLFEPWEGQQTQSVETIDELLDLAEKLKLFTSSRGTVEENDRPFVDPEGPIGQFLRRVIVALDSLFFEDLCLLLESWQFEAIEEAQELTCSIGDFQVPCSLLPQNDHEAHRLLEGLSRGIIPNNDEHTSQFLSISTDNATTTKAELVRFLHSVESADIVSATSSLHRYFDMELCSLECGPQHASLLLATAYLTLGIRPLAVIHLHETIKVAQQSGDKNCQLQALLWLCLADRNKKHLLMERVKFHVTEPNYQLLAAVKLEEWRICGKGLLSAVEMDESLQSEDRECTSFRDYLENFHSSSVAVNPSRVVFCILEAELWRLKGFLDISYIILEDCCSREANSLFSYPFLQCLCAQSLLDLELGKFDVAIQRFQPAIEYLASVDRTRRILDKDLIRIHVLYLLFWRAIYRQEGVAARLCFERIQNIAPSIENSSNTDHTLMVHKAHCALARLEDDYEYALRIRSEWEKLSISKEKPLDYLESKLWEADIFLRVGAPAKALSPALQVAKISEMNKIEYYRLISSIIVVEIQCQMHEMEAAKNTLEKMEPLLLNSIPPFYQGRAYLIRAYLKAAQFSQSAEDNIVNAALKDIQLALDSFQKIQAYSYIRECHFFYALIQKAFPPQKPDIDTTCFHHCDWLPSREEGNQQRVHYYYQHLEKLDTL